ncbi:hypothetical protein ACA910_011703 [Epithemia clementina (nom. ined.)]
MGAAYLVSRSQFKVESQADNLDESDVKMHTRIALLVDTLSRGQRDLLAKCLGDVEDHVIRKEIKRSRQSYRDVLTRPMEMRVPRSSNDMRKMITKGKNAFLENLPRPPVVTENNNATKDYPPLSPDAISETGSCGILLGPEPITKLSLTAAIYVTQKKIFNKEWTSKQGAAYLQAKGVGTDTIQTTTKRATNIAMLNSTNIDDDDEVVGEMFELFHEDPTMFAIYKGPVTWDSDADINDNVDVVMHLLFLGIVKSAIEQTTKWLKKRMKYGSFVKTTDGLLEMVQHLNLDWCRVLGFQRGKLGERVSENYLGFARLPLWFFSMIYTVAIDEEYQEPLGDSRNWNKKENTSWLSARGLDKKGSAQELKERVQTSLQQTNIPLPRQSSGSVKGVVDVWKSLHSLLQIVMRTGEDAIKTEEIDFWVKRFLSCYAKVDQGLQSSEDSHEKPSWVTSYNFMSLLNLPDAVRRFGPLRNIWEGGTQGEGFFRYVKREMSMGLQNNWQKRLLTRIYKLKSLAMLLSVDIGMEEDTFAAADEDDDSENEDDKQNHSGKYFVYNDFGILLSNFSMGCAISGIFTDGKIFAVYCLGSREQKLVPIEQMDPKNSFHRLVGHDYYSWKIITEKSQFISRHYEKVCLLLPLLTEERKAQCMFTVITNDWSNLS